MKAITLTEHDDAGVLSLQDVPEPRPAADQLLIEVRAAGVDPADLADPRTEAAVPGHDLAGVVVGRGAEVTGFVVGDEVYASAEGAYAERVTVAERDAAHKPAGLTFVEAAAVPHAAAAALQALRAAGTGEGDVVLVHGAAGGVGHFAVQIARALGAERVLGTAEEADHDFLRELGAEPVTEPAEPVDVALDLTGGDTTAAALREVRDPARAVSTVNPAITAAGGQHVTPQPSAADLRWLADLADRGLLRVALHRELPLAEATDAHRLLRSGRVRGKLVLTP
ncbi:NADP-dependent oxidoreductase [Dactylosporangium sp. CA-092794]|uniref:NADP-dependent oxidoreductase n=1 Tax=Dactylosporangium sp. CA-092794 TaxID=3239929 RepID=UPI003D94E764